MKRIAPMWKIHDTPHSGIANPLNTNAITFPEHWVDEANPNTAPRFLGGFHRNDLPQSGKIRDRRTIQSAGAGKNYPHGSGILTACGLYSAIYSLLSAG